MDLYNELEEMKELEEKITELLPEGTTFEEIINAVNESNKDYELSEELINMAEDYLGWYWEVERELAEVQRKFNELKW